MEEQEIKEAFAGEIGSHKFGAEAGLSKFQVYDYRKRFKAGTLSIGTMLEVLWKLNKLELI